MFTAKMLDVTLRDGGHLTNFHFDDATLQVILSDLDQAGVDCIEIGYRNGSIAPLKNIGRAGLCPDDYIQQCRHLIKRAQIAVMIHPKHVQQSEMTTLKALGVDLIRICVAHGELKQALAFIPACHKVGLQVSLNFIHVSQYEQATLNDAVASARMHQPDLIYFADSNGSLLSDQVATLFKHRADEPPPRFGFHPHDQLGLAQMNAITALKAGVHYLDGSLLGMGKGTGNLKLEFFLAYLHASNIKQYDLVPILHACDHLRQHLHIGQAPYASSEFIRGIYDLSTSQVQSIQATTPDLDQLLTREES